MNGTTEISITLGEAVAEIDAEAWDACACPEAAAGGRPDDPFTTHRLLAALEKSGSVGPGTGWTPRPLVARVEERIVGLLPLYLKSHSQGEYVFDHHWAQAFENAGGRYYPKLQIAVPFTPVTGRRLLCLPGLESTLGPAMLGAAADLCRNNGLSSVHMTFCTEPESQVAIGRDYLHRTGQQYHWLNRGYADFEAFLASLSSRKRKALRHERAGAAAFGGRIEMLTGAALTPAHWDAFWTFYQDTGNRKWGRPYLTRDFFDLVHQTMRDDVLLILASRNGRPVAGALNFIGRDTLYGRYWGCTEHHPFLHFEMCYYQAIDFALAHGLTRVEAGAQGEHKLARGYLPVATHSAHWIADPGFRRAVDEYLDAERSAVAEEIEVLTRYGPFRKTAEEPE